MSLLDGVLNMVTEQLSSANNSGQASDLLNEVVGLVRQNGGLGNLIDQLQQGGLADAVASWVGTGANQSVSASALQQALGSDLVSGMAQKIGLSSDTVSSLLTQVLPMVVDHLTPDGQVPADDLVQQGLSMLQRKLFS